MKLGDTSRPASVSFTHFVPRDHKTLGIYVYIYYTLALSILSFVTILKYYDANARMSHVPGSDLVLNMAKGILFENEYICS